MRLWLSLTLALWATTALGQTVPGRFPANTVYGNPTGAEAQPRTTNLTTLFDSAFCGTNGQILQRVGGTWGCAAPAAAALTVGTTTISSGTSLRVLYDNAGVLGEYTNVQLTALCQQFTSALSGCVPLSGGGSTNFLRADGSWSVPPGATSGTVTSVAAGTGISASPSPIVGSGTISLANIANNTVLGNVSGSANPPSALTTAQHTTLCDTFSTVGTTKGCVGGSSGAAGAFLNSGGTWTVPPGTAGGTISSAVANQVAFYTAATTIGGNANFNWFSPSSQLRMDGSTTLSPFLFMNNTFAGNQGSLLRFTKSRTSAAITSGDVLGRVEWEGYDSTNTAQLTSLISIASSGVIGSGAGGITTTFNIWGGQSPSSGVHIIGTQGVGAGSEFIQFSNGNAGASRYLLLQNSLATLGVPGAHVPLVFSGSTSGSVVLQGPATASGTLTLPARTADVATTTGTLTSGRCTQFDASGNIVQASAACGTVTGSSLTANALLVGGGGSAISALSAVGTTNQILVGNTGANPSWTSTLPTAATPAYTGDVTKSAGSLTTVLANIPSATPAAGSILFTEIAAPSTPAAGKGSVWADSTNSILSFKSDAGTVSNSVVPDTGAANNFLTAISAAGVISKAQPAFSNLSGSATLAQFPTIAADTVLGNPTAATAVPAAMALSSCSTAGTSALTYNTTTHAFGCNTLVPGSNTQVIFNNSGAFGASANLTWVSPTLTIGAAGVTGRVALAGSTSGTTTLQAAATASGNLTLPARTATVATTTGTLTSNNCADFDASSNIVDAGAPCGVGTVNSGTANQLAYYASSTNAVSGNANHTVSTGTMTHGVAGSVVGASAYANATSGSITVQPQTGALGSTVLTLPARTATIATSALQTTYTTVGNSTHTFATGAVTARFIGCGAGGAGGSGGKQTSGSAISGGGGGGGGACFDRTFTVAELGASVRIFVGTGGATTGLPGAGPVDGVDGGAGTLTCVTSAASCTGTLYLVGGPGGGGAGGVLAAASGGGGGGCPNVSSTAGNYAGGSATTTAAGTACTGGNTGGSGSAGTNSTVIGFGSGGGGASTVAAAIGGTNYVFGASGGGSGGAVTSTPGSVVGAAGGWSSQTQVAANIGAAGAVGGAGGTAGASTSTCVAGGGGGGGGANHTGNAGNGGAGIQGGGGGGGGSSLNANTPGTGGAGGNGFVCVTEYF